MRKLTIVICFCYIFVEASFALMTNKRNNKQRQISRGYLEQGRAQPFVIRESSLYASASDDDEGSENKKKKKQSRPKKGSSKTEERNKKKEEVMRQLKAKLEEKKKSKSDGGILNKLNPFQAGQSLRKTIGDLGTLTTIGSGLSDRTKQKYYLDDRFLEGGGNDGALLTERNPYLERLERDNYVPEVLVVGATGEVGRLVVRRLLLEGRFRVRVLVRDLYSQTLNLLGTGVTYCQGDLGNVESLEYALTDVDKIIFCAAAPRPDETDFQEKFKYFMDENLSSVKNITDVVGNEDEDADGEDWEKLTSVLDVRSKLAEQVDCIGMQNLVAAYQNVRHADYGTSQAAKRSLFKFGSRLEDFNLFSIDDNSLEDLSDKSDSDFILTDDDGYFDDMSDEELYDMDDEYDDYDETYYDIEERRDATVKTQIQWIRNEFGHGVFVGRIPKATSGIGGEATVVSSRLRSREEPENGIDLSSGFAGFIVRLCGDGGNYEAFIRTGSFEEDGIEYVCEFGTSTKRTSLENKSRNKFITRRLSFQSFKPVLKKEMGESRAESTAKPFNGKDVRYIGFRYRSESNGDIPRLQDTDVLSFYMALSYIKVYRVQPEPEFVYLSDSRIPPRIRSSMVRHDRRQLLTRKEEEEGETLLDEKSLKESLTLERSTEETYFKFRGEEILKSSGLSYTIVRISGFNEVPSGEASTIDLKGSNRNMLPVSRADAAQVCVSALLDPNALNKSVYMTKKRSSSMDEDFSAKFLSVKADDVL